MVDVNSQHPLVEKCSLLTVDACRRPFLRRFSSRPAPVDTHVLRGGDGPLFISMTNDALNKKHIL